MATATVALTVKPATPAITWTAPAGIAYGTALGSIQLDAAASVPGTFAYAPAAGAVLAAGAQTLTVTFTPTDTVDFLPASASVNLAVSKAVPQLAWPTPAPIVYGTSLSASQLNATASVPGMFTYSRVAGDILPAGTDRLTATFTPSDNVDYAGATATVLLTVSQGAVKISWANPAGIVFGTPLGSAQLNASAPVAGTFAYSPVSGTVLPVGNQTLSATFTPADATDYGTATASVVLPVINPAPVLVTMSPAYAVAGGAAFHLSVSGAGFVPGSTVLFGGSAVSTQYVSDTQLTASIPASAIANAGMAMVTIQTGTPGGGSSAGLEFESDSASSLDAGPPSFTTGAAMVSPGASATYAVTLPSSVMSATAGCLNLPSGASCSYANGVVTVATSANTPAGTYVITVVFTETLAGVAAGFSLPLLLLVVRIRRRSSHGSGRWVAGCAALALMAVGLVFTGCGGNGGSGSGTTPTSPATHQATSSATVRT